MQDFSKLSLKELDVLIDEERKNIVPFTPADPKSRWARLFAARTAILKRQREDYEDKHYRTEIDCPAHTGKHTAVLYQHGHRFAGIWECPKTGETDSCEHESTHIEITEDWPSSPVSTPHEYEIYVCDACECVADGDPAEDRADALADMQIMEARGK